MRKPDSELTEANRITLPGQRLNNLNKWLTRAMSSLVGARVVCLGLGTRMNINNLDVQINRAQATMRLLNEGDVRLWHLADMGCCTANVRFRGQSRQASDIADVR